MIDWSQVGKECIVVRVPTEQAVIEFFDELLRRCPELNIPPKYVLSVLVEKEKQAAVYIAPHFDSRGLHWEYSDYDWYATHSPYCNSKFFDWEVTPVDLGEIDTEDSIDVNSLFGEVMS